MEARRLRIGIILRMLAWGGTSGVILGAVYPLLAVILIQLLKLLAGSDVREANAAMLGTWVAVGCIVGFILGGIAGLFLGLVVGSLLAILTYWVFNPTADFRSYMIAVETACVVVGGLASLLLVLASGLPQYGANGWGKEWSWIVWGATPALIATTATWWAGRHVAAWVGVATSKDA